MFIYLLVALLGALPAGCYAKAKPLSHKLTKMHCTSKTIVRCESHQAKLGFCHVYNKVLCNVHLNKKGKNKTLLKKTGTGKRKS